MILKTYAFIFVMNIIIIIFHLTEHKSENHHHPSTKAG